MGKKEKLIERLKSKPKDFTFEELETLLGYLCYSRSNKGKTSGSRVVFKNPENGNIILLHKPHPRNELLEYQIKQKILEILQKENVIKTLPKIVSKFLLKSLRCKLHYQLLFLTLLRNNLKSQF